MKAYQAIAAAIAAEGCPIVFGVMGDGNMWLWDAIHRGGASEIWLARHENAAVAMADGYSRTTNGVGVATVTHGPGLTQVGTALMTAARNRTPLVLLVGEYPQSGNGLQWIDQARFVEACSTRFVRLSHRNNIAREVAEAFYLARAHRGPVALSMPVEIQEEEVPEGWAYRPSTEFLDPHPPLPHDLTLHPLADALAKAERPVIVAGRGARIAGAREAIVALADRIGALLATSLLNKEFFAGHPYDVGISGGWASAPTTRLLADADLVLGIGADLGFFTTQGGALYPKAAIARIDAAPIRAGLGYTPGLYIQGDAKATAGRLGELLAGRGVQKEGFRTAAVRAVLDAPPAAWPAVSGGLDPRRLMRNLAPVLPQGVLATIGCGHFSSLVAMHLALPEGAEFNIPIQFAAIGQGLPFAIGIGAAHPNRPHLVIEGDGSLLMCLPELETVVRRRQDMVLLVWNDGGFGAETQKFRARGMDQTAAQWPSPDFVAVARALGADGIRIACEDEIGPAVAAGLARGGLFVIDVPVSPNAVADHFLRHFGKESTAPLLRRPA